MTLELAYWLVLALGLAFLVASLLFDDVSRYVPLPFRRDVLSSGPVVYAAAAAFGAGGLVGHLVLGLENDSLLVGCGAGAVIGGSTALMTVLAKRYEAAHDFERAKLVGMRGRATLTIGPGRVGRVALQYAGMTRSLAGTSDEEIRAGEEVVVRDMVGNSLRVARPERARREEGLA